MMDQLGMHLKASAGGVDRYFNALNTTLARQGIRSNAFGFGEGANGISLGSVDQPLAKRWQAVRSRVVPRRGKMLATHFSLYALPAVLGRRWQAHVVHFHGPWAGESAREGAKPHSVMLKRLLERSVYQRADRFIVLSNAFRDQLCQGYGIEEAKVHVIPGGVEVDKFQPMDMAKARDQLGWPQGDPILVCVRRLARRMGLENLLTAFSRIAAQHPKAKLMIGGQGPIRAELQAQVENLGLSDRVRFLGFVTENDLPLAYAAANLSIVPSSALEGFGLISLESLACGTPVLVTPVGGLPDTVRDLSRDLILKGTSSDDITEGLHRRLDGTLPLPSREACREHVLRGFTWDRIATRVCEVYREAGWRPELS
jgi:glycosyltransferase involved in cell wall biosynthesis